MASFIKLIYLVIALSITADFLSLGRHVFDSGSDSTGLQSTLPLPGANAIPPAVAAGVIGVVARTLTKSAIKAAKKYAKNQARVQGNKRNKAKNANGKGLFLT